MWNKTLVAAFLVYACVTAVKGEFKRVCYYSGWASNRDPPNNLAVNNIDVHLCTHLLFAFANLQPNSTQLVANSGKEVSMYRPFTDLKQKNPHLKTMLSVGGWNMGSKPFIHLVASSHNMHDFANRTVKFLRYYNFDGLDIDWEYPAARGSHHADKHRFSILLKVVQNAFLHEPNRGTKPRLLLSVAVGVSQSRAHSSYEMQQISRHTDFINLMMYDFHGEWEKPLLANPHSSLHSNDNLNIAALARFWAQHVVHKNQLIIGLPFYGHKYTLANSSQSDIGALSTAGGIMTYYEICALIKANNVTEHILQKERVPYIVDGKLWVGYDNPQSVAEKVTFVKNNHYGGVMVWAIDLDDTTGACGDGPYPLMNAIKNGFLAGAGGIVG